MKQLEALTPEQKHKVVEAYRKAVRLFMEFWNETDKIEKILGVEFDSSEGLVEYDVGGLSKPSDAEKLSRKHVFERIQAATLAGGKNEAAAEPWLGVDD